MSRRKNKIPKEVKQRVERDLKDYPAYRRELNDLMDDIATESSKSFDGMPKGKGGVSDPTYNTLNRYHSRARVMHLERICSAIDRCLGCMDSHPEVQRCKQRMIEMLYWRRTHMTQGVAMELGYHPRTIQRWKAIVIKEIAIELGYI